MSDGGGGLRVYGMPDEAKRTPPPSEGFRGERAARPEDDALSRAVPLSDGTVVEVIESSGVAFAEATAPTGAAATASEPTGRAAARPAFGWLLLGLGGGLLIGRMSPARRKRPPTDAGPLPRVSVERAGPKAD